MKKNIILLFCLSLAFSMLISQNAPLGSHIIKRFANGQSEELSAENKAEYEKFEQWMQEKMQNQAARPDTASVPYNFPVIIHIIHNGEAVGTGSNISYAQIQSQLNVLNEDLNRKNADTINTPAAFKSVAASCDITLCPALWDTTGGFLAEPGVERIDRNLAGFGPPPYTDADFFQIQKLTSWNSSKYLNIWVCRLGSGLIAYGQFPGGGAKTDGIVVNYQNFGSLNKVNTPQLQQGSPYNLGRQATHVMGIWLGVRHIWGNANCGNDFVADTPTQQDANTGCPNFPHITCNNGPNGDMFSNFMDWSDDYCLNIFTQGQKARMLTTLTSDPRRMSVANSTVCSLTSAVTSPKMETGKVYPNPNEGNFTFELNNTQAKQAELTLCNLHGQTILTKNVSVANGAVKENIETAHLPSGTYLLKVNAEGRTAHYKVIIAK